MEQTGQLWMQDDVRIVTDSSGYFIAQIGTLNLREPTLSAIRDKIDLERKAEARRAGKNTATLALKVVGIKRLPASGEEERSDIVFRSVLTGVNRTTREFIVGEIKKGEDLKQCIPDTPENFALLEAYVRWQAEERRLSNEIEKRIISGKRRDPCKVEGYGRLEADSYANALRELEGNYIKATKVEPKGA